MSSSCVYKTEANHVENLPELQRLRCIDTCLRNMMREVYDRSAYYALTILPCVACHTAAVNNHAAYSKYLQHNSSLLQRAAMWTWHSSWPPEIHQLNKLLTNNQTRKTTRQLVKLLKHNQNYYLKTWCFDLYQRPSSEAGTQFFRFLTQREDAVSRKRFE